MGVAVADYDGDGDDDLYVTNVGPNVLYRNRGDGTFEDVAVAAGVADDQWGSSAVFVDYDADGQLDLFLVNYLRWSPQIEFECRGARTCEITVIRMPIRRPRPASCIETAATARSRTSARRPGSRPRWATAWASRSATSIPTADSIFTWPTTAIPTGCGFRRPDGQFQDRAMLAGCAVDGMGAAEAGMGVAAVDVDQDGDLDIFVTNLVNESNTLYANQDGRFADATAQFGLSAPSVSYTGFGLGFADFNHDGQLDAYVCNGRVSNVLAPLVPNDPFAEPNQLFRGTPDHRFTEVMPRGGTEPILIENSRGSALGDYNGDGAVDVLVVNNGGPARLLANRVGRQGHWIRFEVRDGNGHEALGARVCIQTRRGAQWRSVQRTYSFLSSHEPQVHFGLDDQQEIEQVTVYWVGGSPESFGPLAAGQTHQLRQGRGQIGPANPAGQ